MNWMKAFTGDDLTDLRCSRMNEWMAVWRNFQEGFSKLKSFYFKIKILDHFSSLFWSQKYQFQTRDSSPLIDLVLAGGVIYERNLRAGNYSNEKGQSDVYFCSFFSVVFFPGSLTVVHRPLTTSLYYLPVQPSRNKKGRKIFYRLNS